MELLPLGQNVLISYIIERGKVTCLKSPRKEQKQEENSGSQTSPPGVLTFLMHQFTVGSTYLVAHKKTLGSPSMHLL